MIPSVTLDGTDLRLSRIGLGTASLHHLWTGRGRERLLAAAAAVGITHYDTSPYYGFGIAERSLGDAFGRRSGQITVATKVGLYPPSREGGVAAVAARKLAGRLVPALSRPRVDWSIQQAATSLERSLRALRRDCVDILFLHEPDFDLLAADEFLGWLKRRQQEGTIRYWGIAGTVERCLRFVRGGHELARVIQTNDSATGREAASLVAAGRVPQLTYGYFSAEPPPRPQARILAAALKANTSGTILVSTRSPERVRAMARSFEGTKRA